MARVSAHFTFHLRARFKVANIPYKGQTVTIVRTLECSKLTTFRKPGGLGIYLGQHFDIIGGMSWVETLLCYDGENEFRVVRMHPGSFGSQKSAGRSRMGKNYPVHITIQ